MAVLTEPERNDGHFRRLQRKLKKKFFSHTVAMRVYCGTRDRTRIHDVSIEPGYTVGQS